MFRTSRRSFFAALGAAPLLANPRAWTESASTAGAIKDPSGKPRNILDPGNVPQFFQTGEFRSARWDGGPIEAEKGRLSGWPNYTAGNPLGVLEATRQWYSPKTIEYLKIAHINWAWLTWSVGFSWTTEEEQRRAVTSYIEECHQNGIRVATYFSIGNMFWQDMADNQPESLAWVRRVANGSPQYYSRPNRYMADIANPDWIAFQKRRVRSAVKAGTDAFWVDNTFEYYGKADTAHFIDEMYEVASQTNPRIVFMSNYNRRIYTWGRLQNGVTTEDGQEPGYYTDKSVPYIVTNAGLLRYNYAIGEGWRPVSMEDGGRHEGDRLTTPMQPHKWQLAIAECAMYHVSFEPYFEGMFLRDLYHETAAALEGLRAIGAYNAFLEENKQYYLHPSTLARTAVLSDTTDTLIPYLNDLSLEDLNYDVIFNYQAPGEDILKRYAVIFVPETNPLSSQWCAALSNWALHGGTLIVVGDASLFPDGPASPGQDFGLKAITGVSVKALPKKMVTRSRGRGKAVYLPKRLPASEMCTLIRSFLRDSETIKVERRDAILSNAAYQHQFQRLIVHLLNYRQTPEKRIRIRVRLPVERVEVLSPDDISGETAVVDKQGHDAEIEIPEIRTYGICVIHLASDS